MNHETAYLEIKKLAPTAADIIFLRAAAGSIDHESARRLREALGAEGFDGFLIVGTNDVSMECLDEEMMREHGWVRAEK
jgi:dihydrodipicolinate synthase/N-acetylneuraminate lyase